MHPSILNKVGLYMGNSVPMQSSQGSRGSFWAELPEYFLLPASLSLCWAWNSSHQCHRKMVNLEAATTAAALKTCNVCQCQETPCCCGVKRAPIKFRSHSCSCHPLSISKPVKSTCCVLQPSSVQFSRSVMSDSLQPYESQHARPPCPSLTQFSLTGYLTSRTYVRSKI